MIRLRTDITEVQAVLPLTDTHNHVRLVIGEMCARLLAWVAARAAAALRCSAAAAALRLCGLPLRTSVAVLRLCGCWSAADSFLYTINQSILYGYPRVVQSCAEL